MTCAIAISGCNNAVYILKVHVFSVLVDGTLVEYTESIFLQFQNLFLLVTTEFVFMILFYFDQFAARKSTNFFANKYQLHRCGTRKVQTFRADIKDRPASLTSFIYIYMFIIVYAM